MKKKHTKKSPFAVPLWWHCVFLLLFKLHSVKTHSDFSFFFFSPSPSPSHSIKESISAPSIERADQRICTLASQVNSKVQTVSSTVAKAHADPLAFTFDTLDATIDYVLPDWTPATTTTTTSASTVEEAETSNSNAKAAVVNVDVVIKKKEVINVVTAASARILVVRQRLLQRLEAIIRYISTSKIVSEYGARIPSRSEAAERLRGLVQNAVKTAEDLRSLVSGRQQAVLDECTARLTAIKVELSRNTLSVSVLQRCSSAVLQVHKYLVKALQENQTVTRIVENNRESKWIAKVQELDHILIEALQSVAPPAEGSKAEQNLVVEPPAPLDTTTTTTLDRINGTLDTTAEEEDEEDEE